MWLIDANEVLNDLASLKYVKEHSVVTEAYDHGVNDSMIEVGRALPVDAEPVVHAHWEKADSRFHRRLMQCSNCGNFLDMEGVNCGRGSANYCPNCGAKMDSNA